MELLLFVVFVFIMGAAAGSFLNVVIDRGEINESIISGRSHCDYCKKLLHVIDLIPVLSYLLLKGKCRNCHNQLSLYYPATEISTGFSYVMVFFLTGGYGIFVGNLSALPAVFYYLLIVSLLIVIFFADLKYGIIPFKAVLIAVLVTIIWYYIHPDSNTSFVNHLLSSLGSFSAFLLIFLITRGKGIGFGDVVYVLFMGLLLGFPKIILGFYIAFLSGAIASLILIALKLKKLKGDTIPFGPFLVTGTVISFFWGNLLIDRITAYLLP